MVSQTRVLAACCSLVLALLTSGCGELDLCAERSDLLASPSGLVLTEEEHLAGWGSDQCLQCHALESTHQVNCSSEPELDMEAVREAAADGRYESCMQCHGSNGIEP